MGEEYGETAPFPYFISHTDTALIEAVRKGRRAEFAAFRWPGEILDPQDEVTFRQAKLDRGRLGEEKHRVLREFYGELIRLRKENAALARPTKDNLEVWGDEKNKTLFVRRRADDTAVFILYNIGNTRKKVNCKIPAGRWRRILDSSEGRWLGQGGNAPDAITASGSEVAITPGPESLVLFQKEN